MDPHQRLRAQIRAGRELLGLTQSDLSAVTGASLSKISRAESGETKSGDVLLELKKALEKQGIKFTAGGVELVEDRLEVIEGTECYLRFLEDVHETLKDSDDKTLYLMFASDRESSRSVNDKYRAMRADGINMRQIIEERDTYILGPLEEYRTIPAKYFTNIVTAVYGNKVGQVNGTETRVTIQHDSALAGREKNIFGYFWNTGGRPEKTTATERFE